MAVNFNSDVLKRIVKDLKVSISDGVPQQIANQIVPVLVSNPRYQLKAASASASDSTAGTVLQAHATKTTYLAGVLLTVSKDANATSINSTVYATLKDSAANNTIIRINYEPTTAGNFTQSIMFQEPVEIEKGSYVRVTNSAAVASIDATGLIFYYEVEELSKK